jgi:hypothetical protein
MAAQQGTTPGRGYGYQHQQLREQYRPQVDAGQAYCQQPRCVMPGRWIPPGTPWDLGHTDDRTGWIGPCHAKCNRVAGNRSPRRRRRRVSRPFITSRRW